MNDLWLPLAMAPERPCPSVDYPRSFPVLWSSCSSDFLQSDWCASVANLIIPLAGIQIPHLFMIQRKEQDPWPPTWPLVTSLGSALTGPFRVLLPPLQTLLSGHVMSIVPDTVSAHLLYPISFHWYSGVISLETHSKPSSLGWLSHYPVPSNYCTWSCLSSYFLLHNLCKLHRAESRSDI